ncbi:MAG: hypothetical protein H6704_21845 [Myxococcales bacterium]|nr:hypothetical protein [Myxococcales bacterium]
MRLISGLLCAALIGCGADADAPAPDNALPPATCASAEELAPNLLGLLRGGQLAGTADLLGRRLSDAQLETLLAALLDLIRGLEPAEIDALLALTENPRLLALAPLVGDLLAFVVGDPARPETFRGEVLADLRRLLTVCEAATLFEALDALLQAPELPRLLGGLADVLALDIVQQILRSDLRSALNKDGFTVLVCNIVAALVAPGFTVADDVIRPLSGIDLLPLDEPPLSTFLADLAAVLAPERAVLPALQDVVCCDLYGVPRCALVPGDAAPLPRDPVFTWFAYDLFVSAAIDFDGLLAALADLAADPQVDAALAPVNAILRALGEDAELRRALVSVGVVLLEDQTARRVLPELVTLVRAGGVEELLSVVRSILKGCQPPALEPTR